jgi:hypothetical protein
MTATRHGPKRASGRLIGREQPQPTVGTVARTLQEAIDAGEAISVGAVNLVKDTARTAISGARDVGAEAGSQLSQPSGVLSRPHGRSVATSAASVGVF